MSTEDDDIVGRLCPVDRHDNVVGRLIVDRERFTTDRQADRFLIERRFKRQLPSLCEVCLAVEAR